MERVKLNRRVMEDFEITELSSVDFPANIHAKSVIMKRDSSADHDEILKLKFSPLTGPERSFYDRLNGEQRQAFVLSDHADRSELMTAADIPGSVFYAANDDPDDPAKEVRKMTDFEDLTKHYQKSGMSGTLAMQTARSARPDLYEKFQSRSHRDTDEETDIRKAREGRVRQNKLQAMVDDLARTGMSRQDAMRQLQRTKPSLFD
ncbi:hypothetical protein [Mesorhizobium sp. CN2-181]|uniref:hypothetical protein n=1 Tax=Mesorhizobium yinganensis TaxID=3157707 RepID=UPI0032B82B77